MSPTERATSALIPWAQTLPAEWSSTRLDRVASITFSNVDKRTEDDELPVRLCNYVDVYGNDRITSSLEFMHATADTAEIAKFQVRIGDVLATKDSETPDDIAIPALVAENLPGVVCGYHLAVIRARRHLAAGAFLFWAHAAKTIRAQYEAKAVGVTRFGLSQYAFRELKIPMPPRAEQDLIAAFLDASCAAIDRALELKNAQLVALDLTLRAQMTALVTRGTDPDRALAPSKAPWLGPLPATWRSASLKRLLAEPMEYGLNEAAEFEDRDSPRYIRITDFGQDGRLRDDTYRSLPAEVAAPALLSEEDILFARSGATVGKTFIFRNHPHPACFAGYLIRARPLRRVLRPMFLYYYTKSLAYEAWKDQVFSQATIQNISAVKYGYLLVPLPPVDEQDAIIEAVEARVAEITAVRRNVQRQVEVLTAYRKSLIHECVTGIRRVTQEDLNRVLHHAVLPS